MPADTATAHLRHMLIAHAAEETFIRGCGLGIGGCGIHGFRSFVSPSVSPSGCTARLGERLCQLAYAYVCAGATRRTPEKLAWRRSSADSRGLPAEAKSRM